MKNYLIMIITALVWGAAFVAGKFALADFSNNMVNFLRFILAIPLMFIILGAMKTKQWLPKGKQWLVVIFAGVMGIFGYNTFFMLGLSHTSAMNASVIISANPAVTAILARIFVGETFSGRRILGIILALIGVAVVVTGGNVSAVIQNGINLGDMYMMGGVLTVAIYALGSASLMQKHKIDPLLLTTWSFIVCVIIMIPLAWGDISDFDWSHVSSSAWWAIGYLAVFASVVGYWFQLIGVKGLGAARAAIFLNLIPVFATILAALLLGESVMMIKVAAMIIIMVGVFLGSKR